MATPRLVGPPRPVRHVPIRPVRVQQRPQFLEDYPDLRVSVNDVSPFQGGPAAADLPGQPGRAPTSNQLAAYADQLIAELKKEPGLVDLDTTLSLRKPEVQVVIDREAASDLGVPVGTIADTLRVLVGGLPVSKFREGTSSTTSGSAPSRPIRTQPQTCTRSRSRRRPSAWSSWPAWPSSTRTAARPRSSA